MATTEPPTSTKPNAPPPAWSSIEQGRALTSGTPADVLAHAPGTLTSGDAPAGPAELSWRRGRATRSWHSGPARTGEEPIHADMEDTVISLTLATQQES
ncbi:hypothetical protein [Streptomyces sp. NPDC055749]